MWWIFVLLLILGLSAYLIIGVMNLGHLQKRGIPLSATIIRIEKRYSYSQVIGDGAVSPARTYVTIRAEGKDPRTDEMRTFKGVCSYTDAESWRPTYKEGDQLTVYLSSRYAWNYYMPLYNSETANR